jgi:MFS family permease
MARLPRPVRRLGLISFAEDLSSGIVHPILPLFVTGPLGAPAWAIGVIEGVAEFVASVVKGWAGWHSDYSGLRTGKIRWGYGLPILGKALLAASFSWPGALLGRTAERLGKGFRAGPRDALLSDLVDHPDRGRAFGFHRAMDTAGAFLGGSLGAATLWWILESRPAGDPGDGNAERIVIGVAALLGIWAFALTFLVGESPRRPVRPAPRPVPIREALRAVPRPFRLAMLGLALFYLGSASDAYLVLRAREMGLTAVESIFAYSTSFLFAGLVGYPAGRLADRLSPRLVASAGLVLFAIAYFGFAFAPPWAVWVCFALYGISMSVFDAAATSLLAGLVPAESRATALGLSHMALGLAGLVGYVGAGLLWTVAGPPMLFAIGAASALAAIPVLAASAGPSARATA